MKVPSAMSVPCPVCPFIRTTFTAAWRSPRTNQTGDSSTTYSTVDTHHLTCPPTPATHLFVSLPDSVNSASWTPDGHVLISLRHLSQVIKINRKTGAIMWKLGGPDGDFTFHGKDPGPSWQHDARLHEDGTLSLFDNGNGRDPPWYVFVYL